MKLKTLAAVAACSILMACGGGGASEPTQEGCWPIADYQGLIAGGVLQPLPANRPASWLWDGMFLVDPKGIPLPNGTFAPVTYGPYYEPGRIPSFVCH